jgi:hypothetical protein
MQQENTNAFATVKAAPPRWLKNDWNAFVYGLQVRNHEKKKQLEAHGAARPSSVALFSVTP